MKLLIAVAIMLSINMFLFLGQTSAEHLNPDTTIELYTYQNSLMEQYDTTGNYTLTDTVLTELPSGSNTVNVNTDGNIFTDTWTTIKNWVSDNTGFSYIWNVVNAIPNFLKNIGLPHEIAFALGYFWHAITVFLIVIFFKGGS